MTLTLVRYIYIIASKFYLDDGTAVIDMGADEYSVPFSDNGTTSSPGCFIYSTGLRLYFKIIKEVVIYVYLHCSKKKEYPEV